MDRDTGRRTRIAASVFVLAAGALASPHLVLASGLERESPAPTAVGRYLMRHWNAVVAGLFPRRADPEGQFHKQVGIHDFYFGHPEADEPCMPAMESARRATPTTTTSATMPVANRR